MCNYTARDFRVNGYSEFNSQRSSNSFLSDASLMQKWRVNCRSAVVHEARLLSSDSVSLIEALSIQMECSKSGFVLPCDVSG